MNVLMRSRLMKDIFASRCSFRFSQTYRIIPEGAGRRLSYVMGDSMYPDCSLFSSSIKHAVLEEENCFVFYILSYIKLLGLRVAMIYVEYMI